MREELDRFGARCLRCDTERDGQLVLTVGGPCLARGSATIRAQAQAQASTGTGTHEGFLSRLVGKGGAPLWESETGNSGSGSGSGQEGVLLPRRPLVSCEATSRRRHSGVPRNEMSVRSQLASGRHARPVMRADADAEGLRADSRQRACNLMAERRVVGGRGRNSVKIYLLERIPARSSPGASHRVSARRGRAGRRAEITRHRPLMCAQGFPQITSIPLLPA